MGSSLWAGWRRHRLGKHRLLYGDGHFLAGGNEVVLGAVKVAFEAVELLKILLALESGLIIRNVGLGLLDQRQRLLVTPARSTPVAHVRLGWAAGSGFEGACRTGKAPRPFSRLVLANVNRKRCRHPVETPSDWTGCMHPDVMT
jgi:hypothetical protein